MTEQGHTYANMLVCTTLYVKWLLLRWDDIQLHLCIESKVLY